MGQVGWLRQTPFLSDKVFYISLSFFACFRKKLHLLLKKLPLLSKKLGYFSENIFSLGFRLWPKTILQVKSSQVGGGSVFFQRFGQQAGCPTKRAPGAEDCPQGVRHASRQAVSHVFSFFWLDGFAVSAPAQVMRTIRTAEK